MTSKKLEISTRQLKYRPEDLDAIKRRLGVDVHNILSEKQLSKPDALFIIRSGFQYRGDGVTLANLARYFKTQVGLFESYYQAAANRLLQDLVDDEVKKRTIGILTKKLTRCKTI